MLGKVSDRRLSVDLASLRREIWEKDGITLSELPDEDFEDSIRWVDTSRMLVDSLTKSMHAEDVMQVLQTGYQDLKACPLSVAKKFVKQRQRARTG